MSPKMTKALCRFPVLRAQDSRAPSSDRLLPHFPGLLTFRLFFNGYRHVKLVLPRHFSFEKEAENRMNPDEISKLIAIFVQCQPVPAPLERGG